MNTICFGDFHSLQLTVDGIQKGNKEMVNLSNITDQMDLTNL